jgi:NTE family protein
MGKNFGINPGVYFKTWVKKVLAELKITTTGTLLNDCMGPVNLLKPDNTSDESSRRIVLITSNVSFGRIEKFPDKAGNYWTSSDLVNPAEYVRATMSIPFFFEVYIPDATSGSSVTNPSRFVDGGMLSNFPIREFHVATAPRYPTFGIKLGLTQTAGYDPDQNMLNYILSYFSTYKRFYDNEYLLTNPEVSQLISAVDTGPANWLNFHMKDAEKQDLFTRGALAACGFLKDFDWENYKQVRAKTQAAVPQAPVKAETIL